MESAEGPKNWWWLLEKVAIPYEIYLKFWHQIWQDFDVKFLTVFASFLTEFGLFFRFGIYNLWRQNPVKFDIKIFKKDAKNGQIWPKKTRNFFDQNLELINFDIKILPNLTAKFFSELGLIRNFFIRDNRRFTIIGTKIWQLFLKFSQS